jgi:hypothetical protein
MIKMMFGLSAIKQLLTAAATARRTFPASERMLLPLLLASRTNG